VVRDGWVLTRNLRRENEADVAHAYIENEGRMCVYP